MRVLIEGTNTPTIYKFDGQAITLRIEAIKGFTTANGQVIPSSNNNDLDFYLEVPLDISGEQMSIPTLEIDSTEDAYPWDSAVTGDVPGYRAYFKLANGRRIPYFPKFKVPTLIEGDPSWTWDEIRVYNRAFQQRFTALDRVINVNMAQEWIENAVGALNKASTTNTGVTALDTDPLDPTFPIAVGVNSPLLGSDISTGISVLDHGALADAGVIEDATISLGTPTSLTSTAGGFGDSLIGKVIAIAGAGAAGASLITAITAVPDANTLTLADAAITAITVSRAVYGTDNTAAFQAAIDAAAVSDETRIVFIPKGNLLLATGALVLPQGVTLQGSWEFAPDHMGYRYTNEPKPMAGDGTTLVIVAEEGTATGAFIFLDSDSALRGVCAFYPMQLATRATPLLYPWFVEMFGAGPVVEHCELLNPYQGIYSHVGQRHRVRDIKGQPVSIGLYASQQLESSIYSDIVFVPIYSFAVFPETAPYPMTQLNQWIHQNAIAFKIGRVDNAQFINCFTYAYYKGFKFVIDASETTTFANGTGAPGGRAWAQFISCGADACSYPLDIDDVQGHDATGAVGVTFDSCQFTAAQWFVFAGPELFGVWCRSTMTGRVGLINCRFHLANRCIRHEGGRLDVVGCFFQDWTVNAISLGDGGTSAFVGNTFKMGSAGPVILIAGSPWTSWAGNMIEYADDGTTVWSISATANFNEAGNSYATSPLLAAVTFENGWVNYDATNYQTAAYVKKDGRVYLRGTIKDGTVGIGTPAFTLPVGYRPAKNIIFAVSANGAFANVQVTSGGAVAVASGSNTSASLDGISFPVR